MLSYLHLPEISFHPLTFNNLCVPLCPKVGLLWIAYCRLLFFSSGLSLCLLTAASSPLIFKVIIDRYVFIAILNLVFQLILCLLCSFFSFYGLMISFCFMIVFCLAFLNLLYVFGFLVALFLKCINPFLYLLALYW